MTTRRRLTLCSALVVVALVVALLRPAANPPVTVSFVRYATNGDVFPLTRGMILISNCTSRAVILHSGIDDGLMPPSGQGTRDMSLIAHSSRLFEYEFDRVSRLPPSIQVSGSRRFRMRLHSLLFRVGIGGILSGPEFVATVLLPPRPAAPSPSPTNQNTPGGSIRTRTRILICVGLLAVAVGVVLVRSFPPKHAVTVSFVRYTNFGFVQQEAVLAFTNRTRVPVSMASFQQSPLSVVLVPELLPHAAQLPRHYVLMPDQGTQLVVYPAVLPPEAPPVPPATISVRCMPQHSDLRERIESLLRKVGINIASTGFVVSVTLPPREAPASPSNTPP